MKDSKLIRILFVLAMAALLAGPALADEGAKDDAETQDIQEMDGKALFKNYCKVCHGEDSAAGEYTPMSLIMDQWDEFFDDIYPENHKSLVLPGDDGTKLSDILDKDMLKKIRKFCVDHAADSEQPMTCG